MLKFSSIQFSSLHSTLGAASAAAKRFITKWEVVTRFLIEPARRLINYIYDMQLDSEKMRNGLGRVFWRHCDEGLASHASLTERAQAMLQEEDNEEGYPRPSSDKLKDRMQMSKCKRKGPGTETGARNKKQRAQPAPSIHLAQALKSCEDIEGALASFFGKVREWGRRNFLSHEFDPLVIRNSAKQKGGERP